MPAGRCGRLDGLDLESNHCNRIEREYHLMKFHSKLSQLIQTNLTLIRSDVALACGQVPRSLAPFEASYVMAIGWSAKAPMPLAEARPTSFCAVSHVRRPGLKVMHPFCLMHPS